jgi:biopolymer transport protein ExbD
MKTNFQPVRKSSSMDIMMTPMIDVVFLLLIFFLTTSSFEKLEMLLPSSVTEASDTTQAGAAAPTAEPIQTEVDEIIVQLNTGPQGEPQIALNDQPLNGLTELTQKLAAIRKVRRDVPVILEPTDDIATLHVIETYDAIRQIGFSSVFLATH